jgi:hypothetical protein
MMAEAHRRTLMAAHRRVLMVAHRRVLMAAHRRALMAAQVLQMVGVSRVSATAALLSLLPIG